MIARFFSLLLVTLITAAGFFAYQLHLFASQPVTTPEDGLVYLIEPGTGLTSLADDLTAKGVIDSPLYFRVLALARNSAGRIQAGEFKIPAGGTPDDMLAIFTSGKQLNHSLTLIEGWTFQQALAAIRAHDAIDVTIDETLYPEQIMAKLAIDAIHPEGRFLADTYHFPRGTSDVEFLQRAYRQMEAYLAEEWPKRAPDLPLADPYEALILASIIEKETGLAEERPEIAGVFVRRLNKGMRLQTDPTVIYGMGDRFDGNIRRADLRADTPYNTYLRAGLPPTPICLPGKAAIHAALHPADGKTLYFVSRGDGSHYFSATLEEHNRAVRKYQLR
jgi:UPF0755 protein